jgi:hypothetical protein
MSFKGASERMFSKFEIANKKSGVDDWQHWHGVFNFLYLSSTLSIEQFRLTLQAVVKNTVKSWMRRVNWWFLCQLAAAVLDAVHRQVTPAWITQDIPLLWAHTKYPLFSRRCSIGLADDVPDLSFPGARFSETCRNTETGSWWTCLFGRDWWSWETPSICKCFFARMVSVKMQSNYANG